MSQAEFDHVQEQGTNDPLAERVLLKGQRATLNSPGSISILRGRGTLIPMTVTRDGKFKHGESKVVIGDDFVQVEGDTRILLRNSDEAPFVYRVFPPLDLSNL